MFPPRGGGKATLPTVQIQPEGLLAHLCGSCPLYWQILARLMCSQSPIQGLSKMMCFFTTWWPSSEGAHAGRVGMKKARLLFMTQLWVSCSFTYSCVHSGSYKGHSHFQGQGNRFFYILSFGENFVNDLYVIDIYLLAYTLSNSINIILLLVKAFTLTSLGFSLGSSRMNWILFPESGCEPTTREWMVFRQV